MFSEKPTWRLVVGIALMALTPLIALDHGLDYWRLSFDGVTAPAHVTKVERQKRPREWFHRYYATYEFTDGVGRRRTGRQQISEDLYTILDASKPDRNIVVTYCRSNPSLSVISIGRVRDDFLLFAGIALVAWMIIYLALVQQRRENAGIVAAVRRRMQIDNSRRASARPGPAGER